MYELLPLKRPRRNRSSEAVRSLIRETTLQPDHLVAPYFITEGSGIYSPITSLPGSFYFSADRIVREAEELSALGIPSILLFPVIKKENKDPEGSSALTSINPLIKAIRSIKKNFPRLHVMADVALDPFTDHGHDGILSPSGKVSNDETLKVLGQLSLIYAEAGLDMVAPSDMMDGRVRYIRYFLDRHGHTDVGILSYTAKYASSLYAPFREALQSSLRCGDKKTYQMDPCNAREGMLEAQLDEEEGADILMVKPASLYLDMILRIRQQTNLPIAAYHVSGEYAMLKAAEERGLIDFHAVLYETLIGIKRAGADIIISYAAKEAAAWLKA